MRQLLDTLTELNRQNSALFCDAGIRAQRMRFRSQYRIRVLGFKCMDGRINLPLITNTPMGFIMPFRNIGGVFDMGWPALSERISDMVDESIKDGLPNLFIVTYHFSKGDEHRGCRGMDYDTDKGIANALRFVGQIEDVFGHGHEQVDVILLGVETDDDVLVFHGRNSKKSFTTLDLKRGGSEETTAGLRELYPDMSSETLSYVGRLVDGNFTHIEDLRKSPRSPITLNHTERILGLGLGFDWLHQPNLAIIINPFHPMLDDTIGTAAGIIIGNRDAGRIPQDNALLFASIGYREQGFHYNAAKAQAQYLARLGEQSIRKFHPGNEGFFHTVIGVVNMYQRKLEIIKVNGQST